MGKYQSEGNKIDLDSISNDNISNFNENDLRKKIIIPLLNEIGAKNIIDLHGSNEQGIDVFFESEDIFAHKRRFGIQLKKGDLNCRSRPDKDLNILTILNQIQMAFFKEIILSDSKNGKISVHIDGYYIIITGRANQYAINHIYQQRKTYPYIHLIQSDELLRIIKKRKLLKRKNIINEFDGEITITDIKH